MQSMKTAISPDEILSKGNYVQWNCLEQFRIINRHIMPQTFIVYVHWRCMLWRRFFNASIYKKCWEAPLMWAELAGCSNCKLGALVKFQPHWAHNFPREQWNCKFKNSNLKMQYQNVFFLGIKLFCFSRQKAEIFSICFQTSFSNRC